MQTIDIICFIYIFHLKKFFADETAFCKSSFTPKSEKS